MDTIVFSKVRAPWGWLQNMAHYPISYQGCIWSSAEALFQAMRFDSPEIKQEICKERSPFTSKLIAKKYLDKMVIKPRSSQDVANMEIVLKLKLEQHPELKEELRKSGDATLIEDCTRRQDESGLFWGAALQGDKWIGQNVLGKLWMKLRGELAK